MCKECGLGKRFTHDEHVIGLANGEVVRTMYMRPKSLEDGRKNEEEVKIPETGCAEFIVYIYTFSDFLL